MQDPFRWVFHLLGSKLQASIYSSALCLFLTPSLPPCPIPLSSLPFPLSLLLLFPSPPLPFPLAPNLLITLDASQPDCVRRAAPNPTASGCPLSWNV